MERKKKSYNKLNSIFSNSGTVSQFLICFGSIQLQSEFSQFSLIFGFFALNKNGKIAILEFSKPTSKWFSPIFEFYFKNVIPLIGSFLSRKDAYLYLPESVDYFLERNDLCDKMKKAGFNKTTSLNNGIQKTYEFFLENYGNQK